MHQSLIVRFKENGGFIRTADSLSAAEKYHLRKLMTKGTVSRVKRGLYRLNDAPQAFQEAEVARMIPAGIFCTFTAWSWHELTTHIPAEYHVAIPRSAKLVLPGYPPVKLYYYGIETFNTGKTTVEINGGAVPIYDLERSVCDAVKFRNKIGRDLLNELLRNYARRNDRNLDRLFKYAALLRISNTMNQLMQILL